ncbi:MAG: hypothetical protein IJ637_08820, partial [Prevotella sp.]|nr:hypothetical protein [Prevotella sp.]
MTEKTLTYDALGIAPADIYGQMGYGDAQPDEATMRETEAVVAEVCQWLRPRFCYLVAGELPPFDL